MRNFPIVNKARKPKFELHLTIYDLNNVPLVAGTSLVKWHLPNSISGEHRGRTSKCSIDKINHRVLFNYSKIIPLRISIDRNDNLTDCPIEFEVLQEFPMVPGGRDEKMTLGNIRLNLSEYVLESENFPRRSMGARPTSMSLDHKIGQGLSHRRQSSSKSTGGASGLAGSSPTSATALQGPNLQMLHPEENDVVDEEAEEGIVRRYLMQDSKINSTLKVGVLMVQIDGERNYVAPALKTAPMFGGIAGVMTSNGEAQAEQPPDERPSTAGFASISNSFNKSRDAYELQDMYRRALAASWACQPGELPADECVEDIFAGGDGWSDSTRPKGAVSHKNRGSSRRSIDSSNSGSASVSGDEAAAGTLRPSDIRRMRQHTRTRSNGSDRSAQTLLGPGVSGRRHSGSGRHIRYRGDIAGARVHKEHDDDGIAGDTETGVGGLRSRSGSLASLATTIGSDRGREGFRRPKEVDEFEEREDLIAWKLPGTPP
ncbi:N-terminal C2 in EEIG1 and EHBP1 proteins-domain-containing protein [Hypoxylon trugodes]|uniref:N-terminal C2 in EEIG1 and EHBP1 proteins-domain-containing protein n=1 Tax=Hypoxylon trugodes TaxID=326681 RepID=UPI0021A1AD65|nr:N-terminal C2 in EEIG1 and EHBP1 proteins-domain-containing protein [Hypoxylon trugodes]KAI1392162.1 N-terminal C2 in EEIG1 and EHBP1 proteins-domain-containing protein [Hypoxylon trugodes]